MLVLFFIKFGLTNKIAVVISRNITAIKAILRFNRVINYKTARDFKLNGNTKNRKHTPANLLTKTLFSNAI
jgi:hypothetical protein